MYALRDIIDANEFQSGLLVGFCCVLVACVISAIERRAFRPQAATGRVTGVAGVTFAIASALALHGFGPYERVSEIPGALIVSLVGLGAAGMAGGLARVHDGARIAASAVLSVPFAWLLAEHSDLSGPGWSRTTVLVGIVLVGPLTAESDRRLGSRRGHTLEAAPLLLLVSVGGLYATVPDTEQALVLLGAATAVALMVFFPRAGRLGAAGANVAVATMLWAAAHGAVGRPASIIGALGTFALFVTLPIGRLIPKRPWARLAGLPDLAALAILAGAQAGLALYAAQVVGPEHDVTTAVVLSLPLAVGALVLGWLLTPLATGDAPARPPDEAQASSRERRRSRS